MCGGMCDTHSRIAVMVNHRFRVQVPAMVEDVPAVDVPAAEDVLAAEDVVVAVAAPDIATVGDTDAEFTQAIVVVMEEVAVGEAAAEAEDVDELR